MSDRVGSLAGGVMRRVGRLLNFRPSEVFSMLFHQKVSGSIGAVAGFAIAVVFAWKFLRPRSPARPRRKPQAVAPNRQSAPRSEPTPKVYDPTDSIEIDHTQIVKKKLHGCRKVTCQLLGVVLEEKTPEELMANATVRISAVEILLKIAGHCDLYLMETVRDDESEERVLLALEKAGLFHTGGLMRERVLFCSTEVGRTSFVRQLESDLHVDSSLDVISQLSRFMRCLLYIAPMETGQMLSNVYNSPTLEQYFS